MARFVHLDVPWLEGRGSQVSSVKRGEASGISVDPAFISPVLIEIEANFPLAASDRWKISVARVL
jgi:hypothetical protein